MNYIEGTVQRIDVSPEKFAGTRETYEQIEYLPPITYKNTSRYKGLRTIQDENGNIYHESWFQKFVDKSADDVYFKVTKNEENRLDIISTMYYNTPRYWWVIALANYIIDPFQIPMNTVLRIPPIISLYNKGGVFSG